MKTFNEYLKQIYYIEENPTLGSLEIESVKQEIKKQGEKITNNLVYIPFYKFIDILKQKVKLHNILAKQLSKKIIEEYHRKANKSIQEYKEKGINSYFFTIPSEQFAHTMALQQLWEKLGNTIFFSVYKENTTSQAEVDFFLEKRKVIQKALNNNNIEIIVGEIVS